MKKILLSCSALVLLAACDPATVTSTDSGTSTATETTAMADIGTWGFDVDGMDASYHPGDDFFRYANGTWLDNTTIPEDRSNYGMFTALAIEAEQQVQEIILELASANAEAGSPQQQA